MALRLASKINRNILTTFSKRTASTQRCTTAAADARSPEEDQKPPPPVQPQPVQSNLLVELISQPYKVCRPRTTPVHNKTHHRIEPLPFSRYDEEIATRNAKTKNVAQRMSVMNLSMQGGNTLLEERVSSSDSPMRRYSTCGSKKKPEKKCKAVEQKTICKKLQLPNCMPAKKTICRGREFIHKECQKKLAPYPCFSETCVEEPYNKPSECKLCPWKPEDNPNFKPTKKKYHTNAPEKPPARFLEDVKEADELYETMKDVVQEKDAQRTLEWIQNLQTDVGIPSMELAGKKKTSKCVKFPFKKETYEIGKKKVVQEPEDKCAKKKRKLIVDCPDEKEDKCADALVKDALQMCEYHREGHKDPNCPVIDNSTCDDKPQKCVKIRKKSKICPPNLIKKPGYTPLPDKKKKKKKSPPGKKASETSSFVTAPESRNTPTQQPCAR